MLLHAANGLDKRFISKFSNTNDPNSFRREVNEVYSGLSGPPVSSCFLSAYISWCFLLLLTFKAPAAQSGLMVRAKYQLFTYSPKNQSNRGRDSENLLDESIKIYKTRDTGQMWDIKFQCRWLNYVVKGARGEKQEGLGLVGACKGWSGKAHDEQWNCWHDKWVYRNQRCKLKPFFTAAPPVPTSLYSPPFSYPLPSSLSALLSVSAL